MPLRAMQQTFIFVGNSKIMVGVGILMIIIGSVSVIQYLRGKLFQSCFLHGWWISMMPSGFIALLAGWFTTEIGRQPYTVYGIIRVKLRDCEQI